MALFKYVLTIALAANSLLLNGADGYLGAEACKICHPKQFAGQSVSGHAQALRATSAHPLSSLFQHQKSWQRTENYDFQFTPTANGMTVQAFDLRRRETFSVPIEWAFGAGLQAVTFVSQITPTIYLEHSFSYYTATRTMDLTPGHSRVNPESLPLAMGVLKNNSGPKGGIRQCFECHSTGPVTVSARGVEPSEPGVRCEVCHGPGEAHREAARKGNSVSAKQNIRNPRRFSAHELNEFCGACHRFPGPDFVPDWNVVWNARHQPPFLRESRCFSQSNGALSCLTCHDLHGPLQRNNAAHYAAKCVACHAQSARLPPLTCRKPAADCVGCHMPAVQVTKNLRFANHRIAIYRGGDALRPVRRQP